MPEKIEIVMFTNALDREFRDKMCYSIYINEKSRYFNKPLKGFEAFKPINGIVEIPLHKKCQFVDHKGKKIVFFFEGHCFVSSCGLEGHWGWEPEKHSGIILSFENRNGYFTDSRHFGTFDIISRDQINNFLSHIGPDYFRGEVSLELFYSVISQKKLKGKQICWFLMEQKFFSGIGNWLKADILYLSSISPYRTLASLSFDDVFRLYNTIMYVLQEAYYLKGCTFKSYRDPDGNIGEYKNVCYGREKDKDGCPILTVTLSDKRTTHFCPMKQF